MTPAVKVDQGRSRFPTRHFDSLPAGSALDGGMPKIFLDFEMLTFEPSPTTVGLKFSLANV
jgi:hypothetical protein